MPVDPIKSKNEFNTRSSEAAAAPAKSVATHEDSTLKSAGSKSDDSFDCLACVKYYASAALDGVYYVCDFVYNLLFGTKTPEKPKAEEKPKAAEEKPKREDTSASSTAAPIVPSKQPESPKLVPTKQPESPKPVAVPAVVKEEPKKEEKKNEEPTAAPTPIRTEQPEPTKPVAEVAPDAPAAKRKGNPQIIKALQDNYLKHKEETIAEIRSTPARAMQLTAILKASIGGSVGESQEAATYFVQTKFFELQQLSLQVKRGDMPVSMLTLSLRSLPAPYDIFEEPTAVELALTSIDVKEEPKKAENKSEERAASPVPVTLYTPAVELPKPVVAPVLVASGPKEKGDPEIIRVLQEGYEKGRQATIERIRQAPGQVMAAIADFMEKINGDKGRGSKEASTYFNKSKLMELGFSTTPFEKVLPGLESLPAPFDIFEMPAAVTPAVQPAAVRVEPKKEPQTKADLAKTVLVRQQSTEIVAGRLLQLQTNFEKAKAYALATIAEGKDDASDIATQFLDRIGQGEETKNKGEIVKGTKEHNKYAFEITLDVRQAANNRELQDNAARLGALKDKIAEIQSPQQFFAAQWPKPTHDSQVIAQLQVNFTSAKAAALTKIENRQEKAVAIASAFMKQVMTELLASKEEASKYSEAVMMPFFFNINDSNDLAILLTSIQQLKSPEDFFKTLKA